jgi:hypothetical protein
LATVNWRSRARAALGNLALLAAAFVICGVVFEVFVLLVYGEQPKFPRHVVGNAHGIRINQPNARYRHKSADISVWFRINGQGMRADRDYAQAKPAGVRRVVVFGDSFTVGYEVEEPQTYAHVLERGLSARVGPVEVLNAGVSGYSTAEEYLRLTREMLAYQPDVVVVGFCGNDVSDNLRADLFELRGNDLVVRNETYVPWGRWGDLLNTNPVLNLLSERSNGFAFLKERMSRLLKRRRVEANTRLRLQEGGGTQAATSPDETYARRLTAALFEKMYETTRAHGLPLVILSIPWDEYDPEKLPEGFPLDLFAVNRPGIAFVSGRDLLKPFVGRQQIYYLRSHGHWTPFAHEKAGEALTEAIAPLLAAR